MIETNWKCEYCGRSLPNHLYNCPSCGAPRREDQSPREREYFDDVMMYLDAGMTLKPSWPYLTAVVGATWI